VAENSASDSPWRLTFVQWLIVLVAIIGFAFDSYVLLMLPLIARPGLSELLHADMTTTAGNDLVQQWTGYLLYGPAVFGGIFGLLGGYLADWFGRRRVLVYSILLYAVAALASGFAQSAPMLLFLRCLTFIGVCVEFVAAVAWLAELFPNPRQRETILGVTQAFSSLGGVAVTGVNFLANRYADRIDSFLVDILPTFAAGNNAWRYTLISGVIPAIPLMIIRPFLPESPAWQEKKKLGTLKRPSIGELFQPALLRTTWVTTILMACCYGTAYGAIQMTPQIVPGLVPELTSKVGSLRKQIDKAGTEERAQLRKEIIPLQRELGETVSRVQLYQEIGGLIGRCLLAGLVLWVLSQQRLLRIFLIPGVVLIPLVFFYPAAGKLSSGNIDVLKWGIFATGLFTVAQFSFWGNYLPRVYPLHLRGTGESFAANVGGRMIGTLAALLTTQMATHLMPIFFGDSISAFQRLAYAAGCVALLVYGIGLIASFWLPEPKQELAGD
jgi:MFS family permease